MMTEEHSDWKIILADESSRQLVLYNSDLEQLQVRAPDQSLGQLNSTLKCSLCNRPFLSEPAYFTFLRTHHHATSTPLLLSNTNTGDEEEHSIPKSTFDEGYYSRFFREIRKLGRGAGGSVYHCQHVLHNNQLGSYAVKKIPVGDDPAWLTKMLREAQILSEISKHPNVIEYKHCWLETWQPTPFGPPVPTLFLLMEFVDGFDLQEALSSNLIPLDTAVGLFEEIVRSIRHLHALDILHRDLKPENILLKRNNMGELTAIVTDFGECQRSDEHPDRSGHTGTIEYSAPEVIRGQPYTKAADIWSLGIILYQMLLNAMPWKSLEVEYLMNKLTNLEQIDIPKNLPEWASSLLREMLQIDPSKRPSSDQILTVLKQNRKKTPPANENHYIPLLSSFAVICVLLLVCYPCSINMLLGVGLLAVYPLKVSFRMHIIVSLLVVLYFMVFNQPCTSCKV